MNKMCNFAISVNIVCMDYYLHSPTKNLDLFISEFRATKVEKVPILRIYGSTLEGIKTCVHIHGVFPYFYIPCDKDCDNLSAVSYQLASAVDKAINITLNQTASSQQHIYSVTIEQGMPFYGYHHEEQKFFKLSFYNPTMVKRASALLQSGNILGTVFQPFESHIPYKQQFMIDYNLFGMNFVRFAKPKYRDDVTHKKQSVCPLEFDILAADILNQYDVVPGNVACNPGIQYIRDEETKRDETPIDDKIERNLTQNRINVEPTVTDLNYRDKLRLLLKSRGSQRSGNMSMSSASFLDISMLDNTQLEEHAELFLNMWKANQEVNTEDDDVLDSDCILSQKNQKSNECKVDANDTEDDLNFSLIDLVSTLDKIEFNTDILPKTPIENK